MVPLAWIDSMFIKTGCVNQLCAGWLDGRPGPSLGMHVECLSHKALDYVEGFLEDPLESPSDPIEKVGS